jgi:peptidoglycan/LPS O-acetylase OafA/YrhL
MIHNLSPNLIESGGNVALWTMAVDAQFYVLLPIFAWIVLKLTRPFREELLPFIILGLIGGVVSLSISWRIFAFMSFPGQEVVTSPTLYAVQRGVIGMGMCFALGGLLALARAMTFVIPPATGRALCVCGSSLAAILWTLPLWFPTNLQKEQSTIMDVLGTISVASVLFGAINLHSRVIQSFAGCGVVSIAAANAYALYLVHDPVASAIESTLLSHHMKTGTLRFGFLTIFAFFLFGSAATYALHRYVEQPCLSMKEKAREIATAV